MYLQYYQHVQDFRSIWSRANVALDAVSHLSAIDRKVTQPGAFVMGYDAPGGYATLIDGYFILIG